MLSGTQRRQQHRSRAAAPDVVPRPQPEQRQPDVGEHARRSRPPLARTNSAARAMCSASGRVAGQAQRPVGLDRRRQVAGPAVEVRPACRPRAAGSGSTRPSAGRRRRRGCRGTRAAAGPRRPSSRSSAARPATSRPSPGGRAGGGSRSSAPSRASWAAAPASSTPANFFAPGYGEVALVYAYPSGAAKPTRRRGRKARSWRSNSGSEHVQPVAADLEARSRREAGSTRRVRR